MKNISYPILKIVIVITMILSCLGSILFGQANKFYVNPSFTQINFDVSSTDDIAGSNFKDLYSLSNSKTLGFSIGYYLNDRIALDMILGVPPSTDIIGQKEIEGLPIGSIKYAPMILTINYKAFNINRLGVIVGAGINYTYILDEKDGAIEDLQVDNFLDPVLKAGLDFRLSNKISLAINMLKIINGSTTVSGKVGPNVPELAGAPTISEIILNPIAAQIGVKYIF